METVKQRKQALIAERSRLNFGLLYRGYWNTVARDMPFSLIQFPVWEYFKKCWSLYTGKDILPLEGAICGAFAGSVAAAATTPLDVAKTRVMLAGSQFTSAELRVYRVLAMIFRENGIKG